VQRREIAKTFDETPDFNGVHAPYSLRPNTK
jgi:hypothetical protein